MDLSSILSLVSTASEAVGAKSGTSSSDVEKVVAAALPTLLSGMHSTAQTEEGAKKVDATLKKHAKNNIKDVKKTIEEADDDESANIISTLLGGKTDDLKASVSKSTGLSTEQVMAILTAAAPIVLSILGGEHEKTSKKESSNTDNISNLLTSVLGATSSSNSGGLDVASLATSLIGSLASSKSSGTSKKKKGDTDVASELLSGLTGLLTGK